MTMAQCTLPNGMQERLVAVTVWDECRVEYRMGIESVAPSLVDFWPSPRANMSDIARMTIPAGGRIEIWAE